MSNADWYARKLQQQQPQHYAPVPQQTVNLPGHLPSQMPMQGYPQQFQQPVAPPSKAQSAAQTASCPTCYSDNYMSVGGAAPRCFDCGYPLEQSGSRYGSLTGAKVEGATKASAGNDTVSNWNPQGIIGRVN